MDASLLPTDPPIDEMLKEAPDQDHIARISYSDLILYENWESLSSNKRAKRASKLASGGLHILCEGDFISILAT